MIREEIVAWSLEESIKGTVKGRFCLQVIALGLFDNI